MVDAQTTTGSATVHVTQTYIINGGNWMELAQRGNTGSPILTLNGQTATLVGTSPPVNTGDVLTTTSPTAMTINVSLPNVILQQLLCLNKSVSEMMDSIVMLVAVLKQKLVVVDCQIDGTIVC